MWNPAVFFRRARIVCAGVLIEDIGNFTRLSLIFTALKTEEEQNDIAAEGFGFFDDKYIESSIGSRSTSRSEDFDKAGSVHASRKVVFKPMFGLFEQEDLRNPSSLLSCSNRIRTGE